MEAVDFVAVQGIILCGQRQRLTLPGGKKNKYVERSEENNKIYFIRLFAAIIVFLV